jgi:hypothetical protein
MEYVIREPAELEKFKNKLTDVQRATVNDKCLAIALNITSSRHDVEKACKEVARYCINNDVFSSKLIHVDHLYFDLLRYCHLVKKTE